MEQPAGSSLLTDQQQPDGINVLHRCIRAESVSSCEASSTREKSEYCLKNIVGLYTMIKEDENGRPRYRLESYDGRYGTYWRQHAPAIFYSRTDHFDKSGWGYHMGGSGQPRYYITPPINSVRHHMGGSSLATAPSLSTSGSGSVTIVEQYVSPLGSQRGVCAVASPCKGPSGCRPKTA